MNLRQDKRAALSFHILVFLGTLVIAAVLYILLEPMADQILGMAAERTTSESASEGQQYVRYAFANMHILVLGMGLLQLLAAAVYEGEVIP